MAKRVIPNDWGSCSWREHGNGSGFSVMLVETPSSWVQCLLTMCCDHCCRKFPGPSISLTIQAINGQGSTPTPEGESLLPVTTASRPAELRKSHYSHPVLGDCHFSIRNLSWSSAPHVSINSTGTSLSFYYRWSDQINEFLHAPVSVPWGLQIKKTEPQKPAPPPPPSYRSSAC